MPDPSASGELSATRDGRWGVHQFFNGKPTVTDLARQRANADLCDLLWDEGFRDDPYLQGRLRSEMERLGYGGPSTTDGTEPSDG